MMCPSLSLLLGGFIVVQVATPLEVCEQRDRKGLYAKGAGQRHQLLKSEMIQAVQIYPLLIGLLVGRWWRSPA